MSIAVDPRLSGPLERYNRRRKWLAVTRGFSICLLVCLTVGLVLALIDFVWVLNQRQRWFAAAVAYSVTALTALLAIARPIVRRVALDDAAEQLELRVPDLKDHLRAALELSRVSPDQTTNDSPQFRAILRNRTIGLLALVRISELLPWRLIQRWLFVALVAVAILLLAIAIPGSPLGPLLGRVLLPTANIAPVTSTRITLLQPTPEQSWVPANEPLATVVQVESDRPLRSPPRIEVQPASGDPRSFTMQPADDSVPQQWTAAWHVGAQPLRFRIVAGQGATIWHSLQPMPRPSVEQLQFRVRLPEYAQSAPRTLSEHTGDVQLIAGSELALAIAVDQPHVSATIDYMPATLGPQRNAETLRAVSASAEDARERSSTYAGPDFSAFPPEQWLTVDLPTSQTGRYRIHLRSLRTNFENAFPPLHQITVREDQPPSVAFKRLGTETSFCLPRELLHWQADIIDEFPVASATLEYSINGGEFTRVPTSDDAPQVIASASDPVNYRVTSRQPWLLDTESLSLRSGDQLRLQAKVVDLKGQITYSQPVLLRVASDAFAVDRHVYLQGHMQLLTLLRQWADLPLTDAEAGLLPKAEQLTPAIDSTLRWMIENAPTASDSVQMEWLARRLQQLTKIKSDDLAATSQAKQQLVDAADAFAASAAAAALFHDLLALDAHVADTISRCANQPTAWLRRQAELYGAYQLDVASWLRTYHARLNETAGNTFRDRAERLEDQQDALVYTLDSQDDSQRWLDQLRSQRNSLENDLRNAFIHGDIPNRARQALSKLISDFDREATFPTNVVQLAKQIDELNQRAAEANEIDQRQIVSQLRNEAAQELARAIEQWTEQQRVVLAAHRLRPDFSPEWIADLELVTNAVTHLSQLAVDAPPKPNLSAQPDNNPEPDAPQQDAPLSWQDHWRVVADAAQTLVRGNRFVNVDALWRPLLTEERWSTDVFVRRVQNSRRWDYIGITLEQAARNARGHAPLRDLAGSFDQLRWDEPARSVGSVIGRRGWDPAVTASAADNLAIVHQQYLEALANLGPPMRTARQRLRSYLPPALPDSPESETLTADQLAENHAQDVPDLNNDSPANHPRESLLEQLAAALEDPAESPESLLQRLEQRLTEDTPMQDELQSLTNNLLEQAVGGLEQIRQQQRDTRNKLESRDPNVAAEQETTVAKLRDLGTQTQQMSEQLVARARSAAARGAVDKAPEKLQAAASQLQAASQAASRADTNQTRDEIAAAAQALSDALRAATEPLEQARSQTAAQHDRVLEDNVGNRQRTQQQMQALLDRTWKEQQRAAQQRQRQWEQQTQEAERSVRNARRELEQAQQAAAKAEDDAQEKPDDTARQRQWDQALERLAEAEQNARARENQLQAFQNELARAREESQAAQQAAPPRLDANNSAAAAATALAQQAIETSQALNAAADALAENAAASSNTDSQSPADSGQPLQMTRNTAGEAARQLSNTQRELNQIAESLRRAGRHEARLGNSQRGQQLAAAGNDLRALADEVVRPAIETAEAASSRQSLQQAPESILADASPLDSAATQIQDRVNQQIEQIQELANSPAADILPADFPQVPGNAQPANSQQQASPQQQANTPTNNTPANNTPANNAPADSSSADMFASPQQAARLLDDVDRLLNQSSTDTPPQSSALLAEAAAALQRQQARGDQTAAADNPASPSSASAPPDALAEALTPSPSQTTSETAIPSGNADATSSAGALLRSTNLPAGSAVRDWAKLRERRTEDAGQTEQASLPPEYREQIEAYFRAIAERSK